MGRIRQDGLLKEAQANPAEMCFEAEGRFYAGTLKLPASGSLLLEIVSPRPLRLWVNGTLALDEGLFWRRYEREVRAAVVIPCLAGDTALLVEVGPRSGWPVSIDEDCPSRNREKVRAALWERHPDCLQLQARVEEGAQAPSVALCFSPSQFHRDGVTWQLLTARPIPGFFAQPPNTEYRGVMDMPEEPLILSSAVLPGQALEATTEAERARGVRRFYLPVANAQDAPAPLRAVSDAETRVEPSIEIAREVTLAVEGAAGRVTLPMPAYESLGRLAPQREFRELNWPAYREAKPQLPEPVLPERLAWLQAAYDAAWEMFFELVRHPQPESGVPNAYIRTASRNFLNDQFVWDSSFTAMCTAYGWRALPACATLDVLYSRQFDGGYLHREHDTRDGLPLASEPDFSPNPPIMSVAEMAIANLTGDVLRLAKVYPALKEMHAWLKANRQLPDGTYWTTGLANGLDNSPSLGDGYPDLTAQMAHDAEMLGQIASLLGRDDEAAAWAAEQRAIGEALNAKLWSESMQIYSTSLPGGGHNPNKVVTAFWPLWAGIVPAERVEALAAHLQDPKSFWRHHPIPSLAADSPFFQPEGNYWLGSTWAPTNFAAIKGFYRAGRCDLARETALRHLRCLTDVLQETGHIWENYCSERSARGNWSGPDYCWSALGPIALLFEVVLGLQPLALSNALRWSPPDEEISGVRNLPLGAATISLCCRRTAQGRQVEVEHRPPFHTANRPRWRLAAAGMPARADAVCGGEGVNCTAPSSRTGQTGRTCQTCQTCRTGRTGFFDADCSLSGVNFMRLDAFGGKSLAAGGFEEAYVNNDGVPVIADAAHQQQIAAAEFAQFACRRVIDDALIRQF